MTANGGGHSEDTSHVHGQESLLMSALGFAAHQIIATWGIASSVPFVLSFALNLFRYLGWSISSHTTYFILSGNQYFPVQITAGLIFGFLLGSCLRRRSMLWVWVIPLAILLYAFITVPVLMPTWTSVLERPDTFASRLSHYFGSGCKTASRCLDQLLITMPFYTSVAYSIGVLLARKTSKYIRPTVQGLSTAAMALGSAFFFATVVELFVSSRQGWRWSYLLPAACPFLMAAYLAFVAVTVRSRTEDIPTAQES